MIIVEGEIIKADLKLCQMVLNDMGACISIKDKNKKYIYANKLTEDLFADHFESIIGSTDEDLYNLTISPDIKNNDNEVLSFGKTIKNTEVHVIKSTGEKRFYLSVRKPIYNHCHKIVGIMSTSTDISELYTLQQELEVKATTDHLTGLFNRRYLFDTAERAFSESKRHKTPLSLIIIDIDTFKSINDKYGHPVGDIIIQFISSQSGKELRKEDVLARVGGEEFAILLPNTDIESANIIAEKIRCLINSQTVTGKWFGAISPKISLGVSSYNIEDVEFQQIYSRADSALYNAKKLGKNQVCHVA